jgi:hypothetical protein
VWYLLNAISNRILFVVKLVDMVSGVGDTNKPSILFYDGHIYICGALYDGLFFVTYNL